MTRVSFPELVDESLNSSTDAEDELMMEGGCGSGLT